MDWSTRSRLELQRMRKEIEAELASRPHVCVECGDKLNRDRNALTCSGACRVAHHRKKGVPEFLISRPRWVRYDDSKRPVSATSGRLVDATDPSVWVDYETARSSPYGVGLGFVLDGDGVGCYDLDGCVEGGRLTEAGRVLLESIPEAIRYLEVSPSATGLHAWVDAPDSKGTRRKGFERYTNARYLTVTGHRVSLDAVVAGADIGE